MRELNIIGYKERLTVAGDTWDALALSEYNEEKMAHHIIEANLDYCDVLIFEDSVPLRIPIFEEVNLPETLPPWRRGQ